MHGSGALEQIAAEWPSASCSHVAHQSAVTVQHNAFMSGNIQQVEAQYILVERCTPC
jgi:hypothetical protein